MRTPHRTHNPLVLAVARRNDLHFVLPRAHEMIRESVSGRVDSPAAQFSTPRDHRITRPTMVEDKGDVSYFVGGAALDHPEEKIVSQGAAETGSQSSDFPYQ